MFFTLIEYFSCLACRLNQWEKMKWSFLLPGVLVALLGLWHAAPSRDETVLLASSQRPADCSHVSACLSVNNCRSLPSSSLLFFFSSPTLSSVICSSSRTCRTLTGNSAHFYSTLQTLVSSPPWTCFSFSSLGWPLRSAPSISHSHRDPAARMTVSDEKRCTISVSWMRGSKCSPIIHHITIRDQPN